MSYFSTVRMVTTVSGFEFLKSTINEYLIQYCCSGELNLLLHTNLDYYQSDDYGVYFGWDNIRWYDQFFPEIIAFCAALKELEKQSFEYQFLRIGENYDDIEQIYRLRSGKLHAYYPLVQIAGGIEA